MKPVRFVKKVGEHIANEAVSFVALIVSVAAIAYDKLVEPVNIPTGKLALTSSGAPEVGLSLFTAGVVVLAIVITYGVVKAVKQ